MINSATLRIHSFVDIITNSSSEIFVQASDRTIKSVKQLVDSLLSLGGSTLKADDLFEMTLNDPSKDEDEGYYEDDCYDIDLVVKVKPEIQDQETAKLAASILGNLTGLFSIEESYNG